TRTSTCRNFATISSGLYRFLAIAVLLDVETYLKSDHFVGGVSVSSLHCMNDPQPEGHMASHIEGRKFLAALGGAASAWPLAARAQQTMPVIGLVRITTPEDSAHLYLKNSKERIE